MTCGLKMEFIANGQEMLPTQRQMGNCQARTCMESIHSLWQELRTRLGLEFSMTMLLLKIGGLKMIQLLEMYL